MFLNQRVTWGADLADTMLSALRHIKHAHPYWNASGGRDHVWFIFGERQTCYVPKVRDLHPDSPSSSFHLLLLSIISPLTSLPHLLISSCPPSLVIGRLRWAAGDP